MQKNNKTRGYERVSTHTIQQVLKHVSLNPEDKPKVTKFGKIQVFMGSKRYLNFKAHGLVCVKCGFKGTFFALERHLYQTTQKFHFNLYGKNMKGDEVMLTKDHIVPRAKGGEDSLDNFQVLCAPCNTEKGDEYLSVEQLLHQAQLKILRPIFESLDLKFKELLNTCPHNIERQGPDSAQCSICKTFLGWYCPKSFDKICHYFTVGTDETGWFVKSFHQVLYLLEGRTWQKDVQFETDDACIFCHEPEERK